MRRCYQATHGHVVKSKRLDGAEMQALTAKSQHPAPQPTYPPPGGPPQTTRDRAQIEGCNWSSGPMHKASAYGAGECWFEPCRVTLQFLALPRFGPTCCVSEVHSPKHPQTSPIANTRALPWLIAMRFPQNHPTPVAAHFQVPSFLSVRRRRNERAQVCHPEDRSTAT